MDPHTTYRHDILQMHLDSDIPSNSPRGISAAADDVDVADGVGERGVHERGVLESLSAAGRGAGHVVGALLVQVEAQVLQV